MYEKKQAVFKSPDLGQLQAVAIDHKTIIFIALGADPQEAKNRYLSRLIRK